MSVHDDGVQGYALGAVFGVVALVVAGVIALACFKVSPATPSSAAGALHVYFETDADTLSAEANEVLARMADAARDDAQRMVLIVGVHAATGDATAAQRRALRVRHALEADGVPPAQLVLSKPLAARAGSGAKEARRVDLQLQ